MNAYAFAQIALAISSPLLVWHAVRGMGRLLSALSQSFDRWRETLAIDPWDGLESELDASDADGSGPLRRAAMTDAEYDAMFARIAHAHFAVQSYPRPHGKTICLGRENDFNHF